MPARDAIFPAKRHALYDIHQYSAAIPAIFSSYRVRSAAARTGLLSPHSRIRFGGPLPICAPVLAAAGCSFDDVVDVTTFHTKPDEQIEMVLAVRAEEIGAPPYPNWTAVGVNWLAGFDFEIKVVARIPLATSGRSSDDL